MKRLKKYKLTDETITQYNVKLHRIEAVADFGNVRKGDKGGFVESENNLSQGGMAWVCDGGRVYENARVSGYAKVGRGAEVSGDAIVSGTAWIPSGAIVGGKADIQKDSDILVVTGLGPYKDSATAFRNFDGDISIACNFYLEDFVGTPEEFLTEIEKKYEDVCPGFISEYKAFIELCKAHFGIEEKG